MKSSVIIDKYLFESKGLPDRFVLDVTEKDLFDLREFMKDQEEDGTFFLPAGVDPWDKALERLGFDGRMYMGNVFIFGHPHGEPEEVEYEGSKKFRKWYSNWGDYGILEPGRFLFKRLRKKSYPRDILIRMVKEKKYATFFPDIMDDKTIVPQIDPNYRDSKGNTALHYAAQLTDKNAGLRVETLITYLANPMIKNKQGHTPLDLAKTDRVKEAVLDGIDRWNGFLKKRAQRPPGFRYGYE